MNIYKCSGCDMGFNTKYHYNRHITSKKGCDKKSDIDINSLFAIEQSVNISCKYCGNIYEREDYLIRHMESTKTQCYKNRHPEIVKQTNIVKNNQLIQNIINKNNYNQINIQPVVNNNHITIAKHGEETISHITEEIMLQLLAMETFTQMSTELTKLLYFNDEVPENKNWTIVYPRNKKAGVQLNNETNEFEREETEKIINYKFCNMITLFLPMVDKFDKMAEEFNLTWRQRSNIKKFTSYFGTTQISKEAKYIYDSIKEMVYNERLKTMKTWKEKGYKGNHLSLKF